MARIRSIKPGFFRSEDVAALPIRARLTWIGLWTQCDDHGRTKDNTRLIKGDLWPLDRVSLRDIEDDLAALADHGRIVRYVVEGKPYLAIVKWHEHQAINRPGEAKHPAPPDPLGPTDRAHKSYCRECATSNPTAGYSVNPHGVVREQSMNGQTGVSAGQATHASFAEDSVSAHGGLTSGGEGNRERRGGGTHARARDSPQSATLSTAPPRRCEQHMDDPTPPSCGACKDARIAAEEWEQQEAERQAAEAAAQAEAHRTGWRCRCGTRNPAGVDQCRQCNEPRRNA